MPAPFSTTDLPTDSAAWHELEDVFAVMGRRVRSPATPAEFYRELLDNSVRALAAVGGAAWLRNERGGFSLVAQNNWPLSSAGADIRQAHESLLTRAASHGQIDSIAASAVAVGPTASLLFVAPVQVQREQASSSTAASAAAQNQSATVAVIEILERPDAGPGLHRGYEQFLTAICDLAADYHTFRELQHLRDHENYREELLRLGRSVHRNLGLSETAYSVANDGRGVVGCDRLSVLLVTAGRRARIVATSGAQRVERRSSAARHLEDLALLVGRTTDAAFYDDGESDALPQVAEALERHAEASHARQIAVVPLMATGATDTADDSPPTKTPATRPPHTFVLVAEQFDVQNGNLQRQRLTEVADVCTTALQNALEVDQLPLRWLLQPLGALKQQAIAKWPRYAFAVAAAVAAVAVLVVVPADFNIEATGTLQPAVQRAAFAPRNGLVEEVLVKHGADVTAGQPLVKLRDPALELELKRVSGELETTQRQIDAVRATKTGRAIRDASPTETYRLSAEERELDQKLTNLRRELELLEKQREQLVVTSPIAGRVLTWDMTGRLTARPVTRGEVLVTVADVSADWQLELDVPDNQVGYVLAAQQEIGANLPVRFRLSSADRESAAAAGHVTEISRTATIDERPGAVATPTVRVNVALDSNEFLEQARKDLRPGVSARAQIECGRRSIGYVWLHDLWDAAVGWVRF